MKVVISWAIANSKAHIDTRQPGGDLAGTWNDSLDFGDGFSDAGHESCSVGQFPL